MVEYASAMVDSSVEVMHDFLNTIIQLKTSLKVAESAYAELDRGLKENFVHRSILGTFEGQLADLQAQLDAALSDLEASRREADANRQKASHIDTFVNELNTYKGLNNELAGKLGAMEAKNEECVNKILELEKSCDAKEKYITSLEIQIEKLKPKPAKVTKSKKITTDGVTYQTIPDPPKLLVEKDDF